MRVSAILFIALAICLPSASTADESGRVPVPGGTVVMGTDPAKLKEQLGDSRARAEWYADETPQKRVEVGAFHIDRTEVTNREYKKVYPGHQYPGNLDGHPVVNVTWQEAHDYCAKVGGRLPTEAEWERAARGGDGRVYPWGDEFDPSKLVFMGSTTDSKLKVGSFELEESGSSLLGGTSPAGSREEGKSPFGALDMAGNAWEWVDGWYDESRGLRLLKGGSWLSPQASARAAARLGDDPNGRFNDYGFRCAYGAD